MIEIVGYEPVMFLGGPCSLWLAVSSNLENLVLAVINMRCGALLRPHIQGFREVSIGVQFDFMISRYF